MHATPVDPTSPTAGAAEADARLLAGLRAREDRAFEELVALHGPRLLATARRILRHEEDARDALQDTFLAAFRAIDGFEGGARLATWLHRIAVNAALVRLRSRRRRPEAPIEDMLPRFLSGGHFETPPALWTGRGDDPLERRETCALVRSCIDRLPESYRVVLLLRDIEELATDEIAGRLGVGRDVVKVRVHRARQALRTLLDPHLREPIA